MNRRTLIATSDAMDALPAAEVGRITGQTAGGGQGARGALEWSNRAKE